MSRPKALALTRAAAGLAMAGWLALGTSSTLGAPAGPADDVQDVLFLGRDRTVLVRLHVRIGDRPLNAAWSDAVAGLYEHLDAGGIGVSDLGAGLGEYAQVLRGAVSVRTRPAAGTGPDTTFARIDGDGDGAIDPVERDRAAEALRRFDQNDDESVSIAELAAFRDAGALAVAPVEPRGGDEPPVILLDRGPSRIRMVRQVFDRLDIGGPGARAKDQRLGRPEVRLAAEVFDAFDRDRDGSLDGSELLDYLDRADPAVELIVRLGPRPANLPALDVVERSGSGPTTNNSPRVRVRPGDDPVVTIELGDARLDLRAEVTAWDSARAARDFGNLFREVDLDGDGSILPAEAQGFEPFQGLFRLLDRDGDGRIVERELPAALALFGALWRGHATLSVRDRGTELFGNFDVTGDARLGLRELREAGGRLASFDRDDDGRVQPAELPRRYDLSIAQSPLPPGAVVPGDTTAGPTGPGPSAGPRWFRMMDRNQDGDLSPREFLGPEADFRRIDADADGLIDAREAEAAGQSGDHLGLDRRG